MVTVKVNKSNAIRGIYRLIRMAQVMDKSARKNFKNSDYISYTSSVSSSVAYRQAAMIMGEQLGINVRTQSNKIRFAVSR